MGFGLIDCGCCGHLCGTDCECFSSSCLGNCGCLGLSGLNLTDSGCCVSGGRGGSLVGCREQGREAGIG